MSFELKNIAYSWHFWLWDGSGYGMVCQWWWQRTRHSSLRHAQSNPFSAFGVLSLTLLTVIFMNGTAEGSRTAF